jgi:archaellum biogenesis protein FlaJ (TadC family)
MTQSIIVYRNPVEQAFWESGIVVPLGGALATFFLVMVGMMMLFNWVARELSKPQPGNFEIGVAFAFAGTVAILVFQWLSI